jgi:ribonuclease E
MANKMLIDASHREETRVVVLQGSRIEEFDFEAEARKQLRGNIYLARVTRVEPSLQAAFIEYGGNRHGFLAFSEIHPDYYQIPIADRQALLAAEAAEHKAEEDEDDPDEAERKKKRARGSRKPAKAKSVESDDDAVISETAEALPDGLTEPADQQSLSVDSDDDGDDDGEEHEEDQVESVGADDAIEEAGNRRRVTRKQYKIQEVIKRRQILLVQVVKEERGTKGAALTTYLSLAGRYSVLMPNTARGGGISRKITNIQDRKRLKDIVKELEVPQGMGVILRTAGANRTKVEVRRDYEYLMRMWETVRNLTLESTAPALVYEEGSLIKRTIRDLYNKDVGEILVAGEDGYREAKDFMRMLMPSHAKAVQPYRDPIPIFARNGIEAQLDRMLQPQVTLKSGGYIIINQTEALVSIDVNSGRSTREHSIENTALQTNLEAAEEVARQLRLRDLAGLIVIDFIDMEEKRNNRAVEKKMKDCLKKDRARIQVGRISHFGLLEMSRQRIRASVLESTMKICVHCNGNGMVRSDSSEALHVLRSVEEYLIKNPTNDITVRTSTHSALYILNEKRQSVIELENRFGLRITLAADATLLHPHFAIDRGELAAGLADGHVAALKITDFPVDDDPIMIEDEIIDDETDETPEREVSSNEDDGQDRKRKKRRRRKRRDRDDDSEGESETQAAISDNDNESSDDDQPRRRRRGRRGGRRNRRDGERSHLPRAEPVGFSAAELESFRDIPAKRIEIEDDNDGDDESGAEVTSQDTAPAPKKRRRRTRKKRDDSGDQGDANGSAAAESDGHSGDGEALAAVDDAEVKTAELAAEPDAPVVAAIAEPEPSTEPAETSDEKPVKRKRPSRAKQTKVEEPVSEPVLVTVAEESTEAAPEPESDKPKRGGWWQRRGFFKMS